MSKAAGEGEQSGVGGSGVERRGGGFEKYFSEALGTETWIQFPFKDIAQDGARCLKNKKWQLKYLYMLYVVLFEYILFQINMLFQ